MSTSPSQTSSPTPFAMSSVPPSTAASSPLPSSKSDAEVEFVHEMDEEEVEETEFEKRYARLNGVLQKSAFYATQLKARMDEEKAKYASRRANSPADNKPKVKGKGRQSRRPPSGSSKRARVDTDEDQDEEAQVKRIKIGAAEEEHTLVQPALITGARLKGYQLEGVEWMIGLDKNGVSGILADEMGLGKTLQTIAFSAYLRESNHTRPFLVVCPLSVLHNWIEEYARFAPDIPVCMYHGTPAERAELRKTVMRLEDSQDDDTTSPKMKKGSKAKTTPSKKKGAITKSTGSKGRKRRVEEPSEDEETSSEEEDDKADRDYNDRSDDEDVPMAEPAGPPPKTPSKADSFPVVVTTYEMIIKDRVHLAHYNWGYIVVDEGHRLKNLDCKLMQEIKKYPSAGRMILTGTPLHNNLAELWSLLNFILPDIFGDLDSFQEWFNLGAMQSQLSSERSSHIIHTLHAILKPFLLRRLKGDVETSLPPKKEYVLYAPLSERQRKIYDRIVTGTLRAYLIGDEKNGKDRKSDVKVDVNAPRKMRSCGKGKQRKRYDVDGDDDEYFDKLEKGRMEDRHVKKDATLHDIGQNHQYKTTLKQVNNMKLQNTVMQLRKVCSHPFLFDWPVDPRTQQPILNEDLVDASGKMMVLDRLLCELFRRKHKVLLFSQFTTMLDIIEDWAIEFKGWKICRIDGSTAPLDRREEMNRFQQGGDSADAPILFLLSTRAGGLGINLVAADTVIFYDQDWNPQMDAQAQDRAHRIGQKKPVLIFRLVSAHTIETKIMQKATEKRKLEALIIAKGKFRMPAAAATKGKSESMAEMAATLLKLEGEKIDVIPNTDAGKANVISDGDLDVLLDRSPEIFSDRGKGWTSGKTAEGRNETEGVRKAAFAVFEGPADEGNDALAKLLGEDVE